MHHSRLRQLVADLSVQQTHVHIVVSQGWSLLLQHLARTLRVIISSLSCLTNPLFKHGADRVPGWERPEWAAVTCLPLQWWLKHNWRLLGQFLLDTNNFFFNIILMNSDVVRLLLSDCKNISYLLIDQWSELPNWINTWHEQKIDISETVFSDQWLFSATTDSNGIKYCLDMHHTLNQHSPIMALLHHE